MALRVFRRDELFLVAIGCAADNGLRVGRIGPAANDPKRTSEWSFPTPCMPHSRPIRTNRPKLFVDHFVTYRCAREGRELPARRFFCRWGEGWWGERWCGRRFSYGVVALQHPRSNQPHDALLITSSPIGARARGASCRRADFFAAGVRDGGVKDGRRRFSYGVVALQHPRSNQPHDELGGFALC